MLGPMSSRRSEVVDVSDDTNVHCSARGTFALGPRSFLADDAESASDFRTPQFQIFTSSLAGKVNR